MKRPRKAAAGSERPQRCAGRKSYTDGDDEDEDEEEDRKEDALVSSPH